MKKILLFTSILFFAFGSLRAQTPIIDSVIVTNPILCFGDLAIATCYATLPNAPFDTVQYRNYRFSSPTLLWGEGYSKQQTLPTFTVPSLIAGDKRMIIVDSVDFGNATAALNFMDHSAYVLANTNPAVYPILDNFNYTVFPKTQLTLTSIQTVDNLCNGDCIAELFLEPGGGSFPYIIEFDDGITTTTATLAGLDTAYTDLCAGNYNITLSTANTETHRHPQQAL